MNTSRLRAMATATLAGSRCALTLLIAASTARGDLVAQIQCRRCGSWVKPRRYDPQYNTCTGCVPAVKAHNRALIRAAEREAGLI
jgi:ribosomal protein L37E